MFPIRDHNPSRRTPYVTLGLIAINIVVFLSYVPLLGDEARLNSFFMDWALIPSRAVGGADPHTFLTSLFLHGGLFHLAGNMLFLWIFGDNLEDAFGHLGFLVFYLACGFSADLAHILANPNSSLPTVGASGAIAGVLGGYLLLYPNAKVDVILIIIIFFRIFTFPAWIVLIVWFSLQLFSGIALSSEGAGIAFWAHVGGFLAGLSLTFPVWKRKGGIAFWTPTNGRPPHAPTPEYDRFTTIPVVRKRRK